MYVLQCTEVPFLGTIQTSISNCCTDSFVQLSTLSNIFVKMLALISLLDKGNAF